MNNDDNNVIVVLARCRAMDDDGSPKGRVGDAALLALASELGGDLVGHESGVKLGPPPPHKVGSFTRELKPLPHTALRFSLEICINF